MPCTIVKEDFSKDFEIDIDKVIEMEIADPNFSLLEEIEKLGKKFTFTGADKLTRLVGFTYKDFIANGFDVEDLTKIYTECLKDLGFPSAQNKVSTSSDEEEILTSPDGQND